MLRLRLSDGIIFKNYEERFKKDFPQEIIDKTEKYIENGLMKCDKESMALTEKGFLISNSIIADLI